MSRSIACLFVYLFACLFIDPVCTPADIFAVRTRVVVRKVFTIHREVRRFVLTL